VVFVVDLAKLEGGAAAIALAARTRHIGVVELALEPALRGRRAALARFDADLERALAAVGAHPGTFRQDARHVHQRQPSGRRQHCRSVQTGSAAAPGGVTPAGEPADLPSSFKISSTISRGWGTIETTIGRSSACGSSSAANWLSSSAGGMKCPSRAASR